MIDYVELRGILIDYLSAFTKRPVVRADHTSNQQPYPFTEIKNTLINDQIGQIVQYMDKGKRIFEQDIELTYSINCYDKANAGALKLAQQIKFYFQAAGIVPLQDVNIAVVDTSPVTDRTSFLETGYQYRYGFDVIIRVRSRAEYVTDIIEEVVFDE